MRARHQRTSKKRGVAFEDAATVFLDPLATTNRDPDHSLSEQREIILGHTPESHLISLLIASAMERTRIISAPLATARERKQYEEEVRRG
jgi:uncharacterized DUF497 family protein